MDPKQPVVLQLLDSVKESYMSNDFKTCQQLLGQLKEIVDQKASLHETNNQEPKLPLGMKSVEPNPQEKEYGQLDDVFKHPLVNSVVPNPLEKENEQEAEREDYSKIPYDEEWITKTNCVEEWNTETIDVNDEKEDDKEDEEYEEEDDAKEDEEEDDDSDAEEEDDAKEDEEEDDDSDAEEDEEYVVDEEEEDDDPGVEEDEEVQQPLRRSSRIKSFNATK